MIKYLELLEQILKHGQIKQDRTGTGTRSLFGPQLEFDLTDDFPILTTKRLPFRWIVVELLWLLSGSTNIKPLKDQGVDIWDEWADEEGELGPVYGYQWRNWCGSHDQIKDLINGIINNPDGRRHIVTAWNPLDVPDMNLPPCHCFFQCYIRGDKLDLKMYQRSADVFLGVPFNIASYALLTNMLAMLTGYMPGRLIVTFGDVHIYMNHTSQVKEQLTRMPSSLPHLKIKRPVHEIDDFKVDDFELLNYYPLPKIEAPVAV